MKTHWLGTESGCSCGSWLVAKNAPTPEKWGLWDYKWVNDLLNISTTSKDFLEALSLECFQSGKLKFEIFSNFIFHSCAGIRIPLAWDACGVSVTRSTPLRWICGMKFFSTYLYMRRHKVRLQVAMLPCCDSLIYEYVYDYHDFKGLESSLALGFLAPCSLLLMFYRNDDWYTYRMKQRQISHLDYSTTVFGGLGNSQATAGYAVPCFVNLLASNHAFRADLAIRSLVPMAEPPWTSWNITADRQYHSDDYNPVECLWIISPSNIGLFRVRPTSYPFWVRTVSSNTSITWQLGEA